MAKHRTSKILYPTPFIVAIGASAGGLQALRDYFDHAEPCEDIAYVVIQHLPADYKSMMPELLSRHTKMPVQIAEFGVQVKANHVYLMPNQYDMTIKHGKLRLAEKDQSQRLNMPIDRFLKSLAKDQQSRAIGIILSGTGSDGTLGMAAVLEYGGLLIVQSPDSAEFSGMPLSVIDAGLTGNILNPKEMYKEILESINHHDVVKIDQEIFLQGQEETVNKILSLIKSTHGIDFTFYKAPTIRRSMIKRMGMLGIEKVKDYLNFLIKSDDESKVLYRQFLIGTTRFFRDESAFTLLSKEVFPELFKDIDEDGVVKIWLIACSTGEEVYSLAISLHEYIETHKIKVNLRIFATDINKEAVITARKGIYSESSVKDIPAPLLKKYFKQKGNTFVVRQNIRSSLIFATHNVTVDPPYSGLDLVLCRNMLIYMQPILQKKVLTIIQFSLKLNGYMLLGNSESAQEVKQAFQIISIKWKLYKNIDTSKRLLSQNALQPYVKNTTLPVQSNARGKMTFELICMALLQDSQAACVLIDANYNIVEALGAYKEYLSFSQNKLVLNLLKMVPSNLSAIIVATISQAKKQNDAVTQNKIRLKHGENTKLIRILVRPLLLNPLNRNEGYLIVFNSDEGVELDWQTEVSGIISDPERKVVELETELREYKRTLQAIMEEVDISSEELKAINEELAASNEELQSANEELHSMNTEFQAKNKELSETNNDMEYFMENANIGTLLLDKELKVRKFNNSIQRHFHLIPQDVGRLVSDFKNGTLIEQKAKDVLQTLKPDFEELEGKEGTWYERKISPYFMDNDKVEGVVVTYIDLTEAKRKQKALEESEFELQLALKENTKIVQGLGNAKHMLEKMVTLIPNILYGLNLEIISKPGILYIFNFKNMSNEYVSKEIASLLGYSSEEVNKFGGNLIPEKMHPEDLALMPEYHEKILKRQKEGTVSRVEYRMKHKNGTYRRLLSMETIFERDEQNEAVRYIGFGIDITDVKKGAI